MNICGTIPRNLMNKTRCSTILTFYKITAIQKLTYASDMWIVTLRFKMLNTVYLNYFKHTLEYRWRDEDIKAEIEVKDVNMIVLLMKGDDVIICKEQQHLCQALKYKAIDRVV